MILRRSIAFFFLSFLSASAQSAKPATLAGQYRIAGVVYDATNGQTLPGARVSLGPTAGKGVVNQTALTGPDGAFAFEHLSAGKYQLFGEGVGFPQQGFEQHEAPYLTGVVVGMDAPADKLVFRLQRGCSISGTVTDEFNDSVRDAQVMVFRKGLQNGRFSTQFYRAGKTDDQGFYKVAPLLPGTYYIAITARPWYARSPMDMPQPNESMKRLDMAFPLTFYPGATEANDAGEIVLRNGERTSADITMHSVPAVQVHLQSSSQKLQPPQEGTKTAVSYEPGPFLRLTKTIFGNDEVGDVSVFSEQRRSPEGYEIVSGIAPGRYVAHIGTPGAEGERTHEVEITGDMTIDTETFAGTSTASLKGLVQMSGGASPPQGLYVTLEGRSAFNTQSSPVDPKGEFSIERLQPGTYEVSIANSENLFLLDMAATNANLSGRSLSVTGSVPVNLAIVLGKGMAEIHGFAMRDGKGVGGTMVLLVPPNPGSNYVLFRRDQSDSDGSFSLARVVPGKYRLMAIQDGWDLEWSNPALLKPYLEKSEEVEVAAGAKYDVKVQVQRASDRQ